MKRANAAGGTHRTGKPIYCSDAASGERSAGETSMEDMGLYKGQKLYYLFDFGDEWKPDADLVQIDKNMPLPEKPVIIESKGESPEQYYWEE